MRPLSSFCRAAVVVLDVLLVSVVLVTSSGIFLEACTPSQQAAVSAGAATVQAPLDTACAIAEDIPPVAPYFDLICPTVESVDAILSKWPAANVVGTTTVTTVTTAGASPSTDAAATRVAMAFRVRLPMHVRGAPQASSSAQDGGKSDGATDAGR